MSSVNIQLSPQLRANAKRIAKRQGVSLNDFILWALAEKVGASKLDLNDPDFPGIAYRRGSGDLPTPLLRGTRIRVQTLVTCHVAWKMSRAKIAEEYDLTENRVREALAFYAAHKSEIDAAIAAEAQLEADHA
jgi:uncharacterized protein (DUF433 family)